MIDRIYRIRSYRHNVYIEVYEINHVSATGRLISLVPEGIYQGTKPERLNQFNSMDPNDFVLLTGEKFLFRNLNFFLKKYRRVTGNSIRVLNFEFDLEGVLV